MDKAYEGALHDKKWQEFWEKAGVAQPERARAKQKAKTGKTFTMSMPPPNVTGVLHQGHALFLTLQDTLTRWHRMRGDETLYLPGSDHASIAVNMQVMQHLEAQGRKPREEGREKFLEACWEWIREYQARIFTQIRAMGVTCDWTRVKFTMEESLNLAVTHAFVTLHEKGLIYRAERLVNWSPKGQTGLSDLEVLFEEREGSLWHFRYPILGSPGEYVVVATTRPETMLGDTAVAVHPSDDRFKKFLGKKVLLPLVNREVPIVTDTFVDQEFGTGAVKITPAHDFNDFEVAVRHNLPRIRVLTKLGTIVTGLPGEGAALAGLDRFEARKKVVARFEELGLLDKIEKHKNRIGVSERFNDVVEPHLSQQWYVKMDDMAAKAQAAVKAGKTEIVPAEFHNQFMRWMENIQDWCISRQLWWGQQIPAYHCACGHYEVAATRPAKCSKCGNTRLEQDPDVLDTWFSSALWPFSTLGWPDKDAADFKKFYPTQVLETGFDILFFWVARMMMMGLELTGQAPFAKVYMHPLVRDAEGLKMSKTKGNVIDPLEIVEELGADTLRLTLNALCVQGRELRLSQDRLETYKNFINKVWNATKFALMGKTDVAWRERPRPKTLHDRWILGRLDAAARDVNKAWSEFRMQEAAQNLYHFVWEDFCDWYLEAAKTSRDESQPVLLHVLGETLKLLHPLIPHVSEELWHALPGVAADESLAVDAFPLGETFPDAPALAEFRFVQDIVSALRNVRAESKVPPGKKIRVLVERAGIQSKAVLQSAGPLIVSLARLEGLELEAQGQGSVTKVVVTAIEAGDNVELSIPLSELVNLAEEQTRLKKELEGLEKLLNAQKHKLSNEAFVSKAPPEVVDKEKIKLSELGDKVDRTRAALENLAKAGG